MTQGTDQPLRAASYVAATDTKGVPSAATLRDLRQVAGVRGWRVTGEFVERGAERDRSELARLVASVRRGEVDVVVVDRLGRLGGSLDAVVDLLDDFVARGVHIVAVRDGVDTRFTTSETPVAILTALGRARRDLVGDRARAAIQAARQRGSRIGRPPVAVDLDRALVLRGQGKSIREVARALGVGPTTVHRALRAATPSSVALAAA